MGTLRHVWRPIKWVFFAYFRDKLMIFGVFTIRNMFSGLIKGHTYGVYPSEYRFGSFSPKNGGPGAQNGGKFGHFLASISC